MKKILSFTFALIFSLSLVPFIASPSLADSEEFTQEDAASLEAAQERLEQINERQAELSSSIKKYSSQKNSEVKAKQTLEQQISETENKRNLEVTQPPLSPHPGAGLPFVEIPPSEVPWSLLKCLPGWRTQSFEEVHSPIHPLKSEAGVTAQRPEPQACSP